MKDRISVGDRVEICFPDPCAAGYIAAEYLVLGVPEFVFDAWKLRDKNGRLNYVQQYEQMTRIEERGTNDEDKS